jgi:hypothetical protein
MNAKENLESRARQALADYNRDRQPENSELFHAYVKGWHVGAGYRSLDSELSQHPNEAVRQAYFDGWAIGRTAARDAHRNAEKLYGYSPSVIAEHMSNKFELSERFLEAVKQQIDVLMMRKERSIAPGTSDLLNQWLRELGFPETESCKDSDVRAGLDMIYTYVNTRLFSSKPCTEKKP